MKIWVNEQIDPSGIIYACVASCDEELALDCYQNWQQNLSDRQKQDGWTIRLRTVNSWDEIPVNAMKLS